jgi:chorismate mutase/prephenate dehydratase
MMHHDWPEHPSVAFLGPEGTYTHSATLKFFTPAARLIACASLEDIYQSVESGEAQFGVMPVENSSEGSIVQTLDCLSSGSAQICGEIQLPIHHAFLAGPDTSAENITRILSHQQSLGQCREWLKLNYPGIERIVVSSNAEAARRAATETGTAAIAGVAAAGIYGLQILEEQIEDTADNSTRFVVVSRDFRNVRTGNDKTSIMLMTHDEPGTLFRALEPFHRYGVSLSRMESRPSRRSAWSYMFYLDIRGHLEDEPVRNALDLLQGLALEVTVLGAYPRAVVDGKAD